MDQCVKFLIKLKITLTEWYELLKEAYCENSPSCVHVFKWYKLFSEGRERTENDQRPGHPVSTPQTVTKINEIVCGGHCTSIRMNAGTVNTNKLTVRKILHDETNTNKVCTTLVPKTLNPDQKLIHQ